MIGGLERFVAELRSEGLVVSPAEWIDAMRAVRLSGVEDRRRFRSALRCTLVKRASDGGRFDRIFDRFFAPPARGGRLAEAGAGPGRAVGPGSDLGPRARRPAEARPEARGLRSVLQAVREGAPPRGVRLRRLLARERLGPDAEAKRRGATERSRSSRPRPAAEGQEQEMVAELPRWVERIRLRAGRRLRRGRRGRLYLRRLFRDNLAHGSVPFVLPRRKARRRASRVVMLIDVSWSVARDAGLFLALTGEFLRRLPATRVFFFVDRTVDATGPVRRFWAQRGRSFAALLASLPTLALDAPSDYGRAFHQLWASPARPRGRDTILVVLGDGRTNRFDPLGWAFAELAAGCGVVLWLVPEPLLRWGTGDSALGRYLPHADVAIEADDVRGLADGVAQLLRRL